MIEDIEPTVISKKVTRLKENVLRVCKDRDRLPHQLFWSLLSTEVNEIKNLKRIERERRVREDGFKE